MSKNITPAIAANKNRKRFLQYEIFKIDKSKCNDCGNGTLTIETGQKLPAEKGDYRLISPQLGYVSFFVSQKGD